MFGQTLLQSANERLWPKAFLLHQDIRKTLKNVTGPLNHHTTDQKRLYQICFVMKYCDTVLLFLFSLLSVGSFVHLISTWWCVFPCYVDQSSGHDSASCFLSAWSGSYPSIICDMYDVQVCSLYMCSARKQYPFIYGKRNTFNDTHFYLCVK